MSVFDKVNKDIMEAMKSRDKEKLEALRNIKKVMIEAKSLPGAPAELSDEESFKIISKLAKQGNDSALIYKQQGRMDLYEVETAQIKVYESYLPAKLSDEELTAIIKSIIEKTGVASIKEMGKVMGIAGKELSGKADGREIADKVKALLS
jgi:hypothetical protein